LRLGQFSLEHAPSLFQGFRMEAVPQKILKVVPEPMVIGAAVSVPPVLEDRGRPTVEYVCGGCGAVLIRADEQQVLSLIIHCTACDAYNSTDH
jgi:DNA-directed RNA polymerase subunit RPC12/RpoP